MFYCDMKLNSLVLFSTFYAASMVIKMLTEGENYHKLTNERLSSGIADASGPIFNHPVTNRRVATDAEMPSCDVSSYTWPLDLLPYYAVLSIKKAASSVLWYLSVCLSHTISIVYLQLERRVKRFHGEIRPTINHEAILKSKVENH